MCTFTLRTAVDRNRQPHSYDFKMILLSPLTIFTNDLEHIKVSYVLWQGIENEAILILRSNGSYLY